MKNSMKIESIRDESSFLFDLESPVAVAEFLVSLSTDDLQGNHIAKQPLMSQVQEAQKALAQIHSMIESRRLELTERNSK